MSTTTQIPTRTTPSAPTPAAERQPVWRHGVTSAVAQLGPCLPVIHTCILYPTRPVYRDVNGNDASHAAVESLAPSVRAGRVSYFAGDTARD